MNNSHRFIYKSQFKQLSHEQLMSIEERYMNLASDLLASGRISIDKYYELFNIIWKKVHGYILRDIPMFQPMFEEHYVEVD